MLGMLPGQGKTTLTICVIVDQVKVNNVNYWCTSRSGQGKTTLTIGVLVYRSGQGKHGKQR